MCDVVQTNRLLCHLGKDYEIKSVLTSSVLESYKHILGKMFPFSKLSPMNFPFSNEFL